MKDKKDPLGEDVGFVKGVGPKRANLLARMGILSVEDLLLHIPARYVDRRTLRRIASARPGEEGVFLARVETSGLRYRGSSRDAVAVVSDGTGVMELVWRNAPYMVNNIRQGMSLLFWGKIYVGRARVKTIYHPEYEAFSGPAGVERSLVAGRILPIYPLTEGLQARHLRAAIQNALLKLRDDISDVIPEELRTRRRLMPRREALSQVHFPDDLERAEAARQTLAYEEMLLFFLRFLGKASVEKERGFAFAPPGELSERFRRSLGFTLTRAQERAISDIERDITSGSPMHRLLQGDVGSGKTAVAAYAVVRAVESGGQAAVMSPTEILAEQTYSVFANYLEPLGIRVVLLESSLSKKKREENLALVEKGLADVVVGTHAIITEDVRFRRLVLAIVDEQHRFGVAQRAMLLEKGKASGAFPHFLVMTATPIPRTLALTLYGNLDVSVMDEKPPGRGPVKTKWVRHGQRKEVYRWLFGEALAGRQAYVVAPLIEKSDKLEIAAAEELYEELRTMAPVGVRFGLMHGRVPAEERRRMMEDFRRGNLHILVSTTVIEVGVDVPQATRMVIEHAERFGLAQLHQLRGRINRSQETAYCILLTPSHLSEDAEARMRIMCETDDGFRIAEEDLRLRGPGELMGTRQHGIPEFRIADLMRDIKIIRAAREDALRLLREGDPLSDPRIASALKRRARAEGIWVG
ncbi:MAG: ATP-dependent DNA helicase RecG [candidate division WOR-3 bacterium]